MHQQMPAPPVASQRRLPPRSMKRAARGPAASSIALLSEGALATLVVLLAGGAVPPMMKHGTARGPCIAPASSMPGQSCYIPATSHRPPQANQPDRTPASCTPCCPTHIACHDRLVLVVVGMLSANVRVDPEPAQQVSAKGASRLKHGRYVLAGAPWAAALAFRESGRTHGVRHRPELRSPNADPNAMGSGGHAIHPLLLDGEGLTAADITMVQNNMQAPSGVSHVDVVGIV
jgi:hypothetical protein